jgi:hypothetical protein
MKQYTYLHMPLAVIAVLGFLAYLLACRPAWSPDGSKVLFPYASEERGKAGVVLYDRDLKKATSIFATPFENGPGILAQWDQRGDAAIVICYSADSESDEPARIHVLPIQADAPKRLYRVKTKISWLGMSFPQVGNSIFLDGNDLVQLNLDDGTVKRILVAEGGIALVQHDQSIFYLKQKPPPKDTQAANTDGEGERDADEGAAADDHGDSPVPEEEPPRIDNGSPKYEVGTLDPESLRLSAFATLRLEKNEEVFPYFAVSPDGLSLAFVCQRDRQFRLRFIRNKKTQESLPVKLATERYGFGNLQWSRDGKTIYAAAGEKAPGRSGVRFGIAEIDPEKGVTKFTPVILARDNNPADAVGFFQIRLSPDGNTVAASMGYLDMGVGDHFLFLVDLGSPDRKVTKVPIPLDAEE